MEMVMGCRFHVVDIFPGGSFALIMSKVAIAVMIPGNDVSCERMRHGTGITSQLATPFWPWVFMLALPVNNPIRENKRSGFWL